MIDIDEACRRVFASITPIGTVDVPLDDSLHRTLARSIQCDLDHPPFDRSVMDGYAVRAADVAGAPVTLRVTGQLAAGTCVDEPVAPGEAMQINTGAPIPRGADAVVRVEQTDPVGSGGPARQVLIRSPVESGTFITRRATYGLAGQTVLQVGTLMTPAAIGAAAAAGASADGREFRGRIISKGIDVCYRSRSPSARTISQRLVRGHRNIPASLLRGR